MYRPDPQKAGAHASWRSLYRVHVLRHNQYGQNFAYSLNQITPDTPVIVVLNETPQTSVSHTADMHVYYRTSIPYSGQVFFRESKRLSLQTGPARAAKKRLEPRCLARAAERTLVWARTSPSAGSPCEACRTRGQGWRTLCRGNQTLCRYPAGYAVTEIRQNVLKIDPVSLLTNVLPLYHGQHCYIMIGDFVRPQLS
jgi:hypothetical protein